MCQGKFVDWENDNGQNFQSKNNNEGGMSMTTRDDKLGIVVKEAGELNLTLRNSRTTEDIEDALDKIDIFLQKVITEEQLIDIRGTARNIGENIKKCRLHDLTRRDLSNMIDLLIDKVRKIILDERKKKTSYKLKLLLLNLEKHADMLSECIDNDTIETVFKS